MADLFVGREQELGLLHEALSDAGRGRGGFVLLAGEPGIGKSRLADQFATRAADEGVLVAWGRCWELGGAPAYWPWTEALRALLAQRTLDASELGQLLPELGEPSPAEAASEHADAARFRLFEAVVRFLRAASEKQPVLIVLEDLHAADQPSLLLLEFVVRNVASIPMLVVATYRDIEVVAGAPFAPVLSELLRERATTRALLVGLNARDVGEVIAAATGEAAPSEIVERVRSYTEGNPLYVREVARLLAAEGRLPDIGDRLAVPTDVRETLLLRIRRLPDDCADALTLAAVVGRDFALDLMMHMRGRDIVDHLEPAIQAGLIVPGEAGQLRFSHAVVSEALYDATTPNQRLRLHREIAEALESQYQGASDSHLAVLAHHYSRALPLAPADKAIDAARRAARGAIARLAYEEGVRLYRMALEAAAESATADRTYIQLLLGLGDAQARAGETADSKSTFLDAAERSRDSDADDLFAQAALGYAGGFVWNRAADDTRVVPLLRDALERLPTDNSLLRVRVLARLSGARRDESSRRPRDVLSREAVEIAERLGDPGVLAYALAGRFCAIWGPDAADEMRAIASRALVLAEQGRAREYLSEAVMISLLAHMQFGEIETTRELMTRYRALGEELSHPAIRLYAGVLHAVHLLMDGRLAQVEPVINTVRDVGGRVHAWDAEVSYRLALCMLRWEQGRLPEVEDLIRDSFVRAPGYRDFRCLLALCHLETGRTAEARAATEELLAGGDETLPRNNDWLSGMTLLAEVASRLPAPELAEDMYRRMKPYEHLVGAAGGEPITGSIHRPLGQLTLLLGDLDAARHHHEQALDVHTRMRTELWIARSECDLAEVLQQQPDTETTARAAHLLARALHRAESLGLPALTTRIRASQAKSAVGGGRPGGLTKREVEVATLVAAGASNRDIAEKLVISERTAETHVQNILTKLGFSTRSQIAAWATTEKLGADT